MQRRSKAMEMRHGRRGKGECHQSMNQVLEGLAIMNESNPSDIRISNWTLATGTRAGERHVYPRVRQDTAPPSAPATRP